MDNFSRLMDGTLTQAVAKSRGQLCDLVRLPPTEEIQSRIAAMKKPNYHDLRELELAQERDAIQTTRPEGCWCLGTGSHRTVKGPVHYQIEFCGCEEGQQAKAEYEAENTRMRNQQTFNAWATAGVPLRFQDYTLANSPATKYATAMRKRFDPEASWFLHGPHGVGKTGLAIGYARMWVEKCGGTDSCLFRRVPDLLTELRDTYSRRRDEDAPSERKVLDRYRHAGLLLLDEIGGEKVGDQAWLQDRLYQLIGTRHDDLMPTIFTSNLTLEELNTRIGERLTWRIIEMCGDNILNVVGRNLRDRKVA